jgi:hypothetical protein
MMPKTTSVASPTHIQEYLTSGQHNKWMSVQVFVIPTCDATNKHPIPILFTNSDSDC